MKKNKGVKMKARNNKIGFSAVKCDMTAGVDFHFEGVPSVHVREFSGFAVLSVNGCRNNLYFKNLSDLKEFSRLVCAAVKTPDTVI